MQEKDPVLEKNFIIFMVLVMACLFGWMWYMGKMHPPKKPAPPPATASPKAPEPAAPAPQITQPGPQALPPAAPATPLPAPGLEEKTFEVTSPLYRVIFTNRGAAPISWELLEFKDQVYYPIEVNLKWPPIKRIEKFPPRQVNLIDPAFRARPPLRAKIRVNGYEAPEGALWQTEGKDVSVKDGPTPVIFTLALAPGVSLKKIYTFYPDKYRAELKIEYSGLDPDPKQTEVDFFLNYLFEPLNRLSRINFHGPILHTGKKLVKFTIKDLDKSFYSPDPNQRALTEPVVDWAGFTDSYFLTALLSTPDAPMTASAYYAGPPEILGSKDATKEYAISIACRPGASALSHHALTELELYLGPKEKDRLEKTRNTLGLAIDYGMWAPIAIPLMYCLVYTNKVVKNFGWSIVILTIVLRMAMFPLTRKGQQSMKEMQKIQPEMAKIRKQYPNDKMKQQEEIYALQRKYKINPLGGCLPMLVQIPIFFAFYKVLLVSIELRHAPWILWIPDLSSRDPLLILPVFMGASQFLMQKLTPTASMDPTQAKMMMIMPLVFVFIMVYFPSGLLLYWTVSNLIGVGQQIYVNKTMK